MSLERAVSGQYDFHIKAIFKEAWEKTYGIKATFWTGFLSFFAITCIIAIPLIFIATALGGESEVAVDIISRILFLLETIFIIQPMVAGLFVMMIYHCAGRSTESKLVFSYFRYWKYLWVLPVGLFILNGLNDLLSDYTAISVIITLVMVYVMISYLMFVPLVVEKKLAIWPALESSRRSIWFHFFKTAWLLIILWGVAFLSGLTFGIAFIWTLPWMYNALAIYYRDIFGVSS